MSLIVLFFFYKTQEADDVEYSEDDEDSGSDETDSDISIDENDEPISDQEEEETGRRTRRVVTKAYKVLAIKCFCVSYIFHFNMKTKIDCCQILLNYLFYIYIATSFNRANKKKTDFDTEISVTYEVDSMDNPTQPTGTYMSVLILLREINTFNLYCK